MRRLASLIAVAALFAACHGRPVPEAEFTPATLIADRPAIPYPHDLFVQKIEGEVMLYIVVDSSGGVVRDSTHIAKSSGQAAFDAAALQAAPALRFKPAHRGTVAVVSPILVPIRFTLPGSSPMAKDSE